MFDFWHRFCTNRNWFLGTIIVLVILIIFIWRIADHEGFVATVNGFLEDVWQLMKSILVLCLVVMGIMIMFGWRPFKKRGGH